MSREQAGEWTEPADGVSCRWYGSGGVAAVAWWNGDWNAWAPITVPGAPRLGVGFSPRGRHSMADAMAAADETLRSAGHLPPLRKAGRPPTRGAAATRAVRVRLTPDEHAAVVAAASARGESLSEYVRGRVL